MTHRLTDKKVKGKKYYIFFNFGGKYSGCYATIKADNLEQARCKAWEQYGAMNVGSVENDVKRAEPKILAYGYQQI